MEKAGPHLPGLRVGHGSLDQLQSLAEMALRCGGVARGIGHRPAQLVELGPSDQALGPIGAARGRGQVVGFDPIGNPLEHLEPSDGGEPTAQVLEEEADQIFRPGPLLLGPLALLVGLLALVQDPVDPDDRAGGEQERGCGGEREDGSVAAEESSHQLAPRVGIGGHQLTGLKAPQVGGQLSCVGITR